MNDFIHIDYAFMRLYFNTILGPIEKSPYQLLKSLYQKKKIKRVNYDETVD